MASSLCACPALFFKILFCVCAANSFNDLSQHLQNVLNQLAWGTFSKPSSAPAPGHTTHTHTGTFHAHTAPLPGPLPFLLPLSSLHTQSAESSHHRRFRKPIRREIWANSASHWTLSVFVVCNPSVDRRHKLALYPPMVRLEQKEKFNAPSHLCPAHCAPPCA